MGLSIDCPACFLDFPTGSFLARTIFSCFHFSKTVRNAIWVDGWTNAYYNACVCKAVRKYLDHYRNKLQTRIDHDRNTHNDTVGFSRSIRSKILELGRVNIDKQRIESFCYARWWWAGLKYNRCGAALAGTLVLPRTQRFSRCSTEGDMQFVRGTVGDFFWGTNSMPGSIPAKEGYFRVIFILGI